MTDNKLDKQIRFLANKKNKYNLFKSIFIRGKKWQKKLFSKDKLYNGMITQKLLNNFKMPILTTLINKKIFKNINSIKDLTL